MPMHVLDMWVGAKAKDNVGNMLKELGFSKEQDA